MGTPTAPTARGYTELVAYFAKMDNCDLEVLAAQSDFGDISEVGGSFSSEAGTREEPNGQY